MERFFNRLERVLEPVLAGLLAAFLMALATDPNVTGAIQVALEPRFIPYYVIAIGLITEVARRRTISRVP